MIPGDPQSPSQTKAAAGRPIGEGRASAMLDSGQAGARLTSIIRLARETRLFTVCTGTFWWAATVTYGAPPVVTRAARAVKLQAVADFLASASAQPWVPLH